MCVIRYSHYSVFCVNNNAVKLSVRRETVYSVCLLYYGNLSISNNSLTSEVVFSILYFDTTNCTSIRLCVLMRYSVTG